jgi:hypothetical protein
LWFTRWPLNFLFLFFLFQLLCLCSAILVSMPMLSHLGFYAYAQPSWFLCLCSAILVSKPLEPPAQIHSCFSKFSWSWCFTIATQK